MIRAVLDAGVLVSAFLSPGGPPARLYLLWLGGEFDIIACPHLIDELDAVLHRPKFRPQSTVEEAEQFIEVIRRGVIAYPDTVVAAATRDPKDDYLVALAQAARADVLDSGDKDLTVLVDLVPPVKTPAEFLAMVEAE